MRKPSPKKNNLHQKANVIRGHVVRMAFEGKTSHVGSALSCVDLLTALYFKIADITPKNWQDSGSDRFILSKGHGSMAWYATLAEAGFFPEKILREYCKDGGRLGEHPDCGSVPGVMVSTGSLGHGLSIGLGMALAKKLNRQKGNVFVVLSDGECNEGSVWEAAMFAAHKKLDNLIAIIDDNKMQAMGRSSAINAVEPLAKKWSAFGWAVKEVNGHDIAKISDSCRKIPFQKNKPTCLVAHTVLGKGVSFMEDDVLWHYQIPSDEQVKWALKELKLS